MPEVSASEQDWLDLIATKDEEAWAEVVRRIDRLALMMWNHWKSSQISPEEISAEVLFRLLTRGDSLIAGLQTCNSASVRQSFMQALVYRTAVDLWRKDFRRRAIEARASIPYDRVEGGFVGASSPLSQHLHEALSRLSSDDRELLTMRFTGDLSLHQIAHRLGISYTAAGVRIHRLLQRLRQEIGRIVAES
jgi:DNA-directed RNA polymerase specialized sigma24 family protein